MTLSPEEERDLSIGPQTDGWFETPAVVVMPHMMARYDTNKEIVPLEWNIFKGLIKKLIRPEFVHIEGISPIQGGGYENEHIRILSPDSPDQVLVITPDNRYGVQHIHIALEDTDDNNHLVYRHEKSRSAQLRDFLEDVIEDSVTMWPDRNGNIQVSLRSPMFSDAHRVFVTDVTMMHYVGVHIEMDQYFDMVQTKPIPIEGDIQLLVPYECKDGTMPDLP